MAGEKETKKQKKVATRNNLLGKYEAGVYIFSVHTLISDSQPRWEKRGGRNRVISEETFDSIFNSLSSSKIVFVIQINLEE